MEKLIKLPNELCQRIFASEFELDVGNVSEKTITNVIQLYVEAISIYTSIMVQHSQDAGFNRELLSKRNSFYQDKIKRLLVRTDVQQCLVGKKKNSKALDMQKQIDKIKQNAPEQAKTLVQYFKNNIKNQETIIKQSLIRQRDDLNERIRRRSLSKSNASIEKLKQKQNLIRPMNRSIVMMQM